MTTLADVLSGPPPQSRPGPTCGMGRWLASLPDDDRAVVQTTLDNDSWPSRAIWRRLRDLDGFDVGDYTLNRHRTGICSCE